jgi:hypothetical protein
MYGIAPYIPRLLVDRLEQPVCGIGVVRGEGEPDLDQTVRGPVGTANDSDAPLASLVILGGPRIAAARGLAAHAGALALFASSAPSKRRAGDRQSTVDAAPSGNAEIFGVSRRAGCPAIFSDAKALKMKESRNRVFAFRADAGQDGQ